MQVLLDLFESAGVGVEFGAKGGHFVRGLIGSGGCEGYRMCLDGQRVDAGRRGDDSLDGLLATGANVGHLANLGFHLLAQRSRRELAEPCQ